MPTGSHFGYPPLDDRLTQLWRQGVRFATRVAIALGLSVASAIALAAAIADNAFVQILIIGFAGVAFWIPWLMLIVSLERMFRRRPKPAASRQTIEVTASAAPSGWDRLAAAAPRQSERIRVLQRSVERSRTSLGNDRLDPDAHDLCVLIDRRLPELIDRELDELPPDDRDRGKRIDELIDLVEQFARHCSRSGQSDPRFSAEVLRRRFEEHLSNPL